MEFGIHLPQSGQAASATAIQAVAQHAEELGYADVWVSDHIALPANAPYPPSKYLLEPLIALTWAASVTQRVRLGTTVLVLPLRPPVLLAKMLGTLDIMSDGRLIVGAAGGWMKEEFDALGVPFAERGTRGPTRPSTSCAAVGPRIRSTSHAARLTGAKTRQHAGQATARKVRSRSGSAATASRPSDGRFSVGDGWHGAFQTPEKHGRQ